MSNNAPSDNVVLRHAVEQIQRTLPSHWTTNVATKTNDVADARVTIRTPAGASAALAIAARRQLDPRLVGEVAEALRGAPADAHVVTAPFLGPRTRERLAEEGIGYIDLCGNMRVVLDRPTVFISSRGDESSPWAAPRSSRSLHAPKACRIVRALADGQPPFGVRQLAAAAGTDPGYVSRLLDLFHRDELIEREPRGPILTVHLARLVRRWVEDYRFGEAHRFVPVVHPHGVPGALVRLRDAQIPHALTARAGAAALSGTALPGVVAAYVDNPERVAAMLGAEPVYSGGTLGGSHTPRDGLAQAKPALPHASSGANLLLIDPFDPFVFEGTWETSGLRYASRAQIIADLLGSPAPAPAQAANLLDLADAPAANLSAV